VEEKQGIVQDAHVKGSSVSNVMRRHESTPTEATLQTTEMLLVRTEQPDGATQAGIAAEGTLRIRSEFLIAQTVHGIACYDRSISLPTAQADRVFHRPKKRFQST
jgi:hypothetical protein